ncbi:MAG: Fic family protein [Candidatus Beckwithbacteria bacterium]|nr:Fic family protein [Patescibacteria group bacterium]
MVKQSLLKKIDELKTELDKLRPLKVKKLRAIQESLRVEWIYNSNAIEGNSLSLGETAFYLKEGLTTEGRPLKDFLEVRNHQEAILALEDFLKSRRGLSQSFIKELHAVLLRGIEYIWVKGAGGKLIKKKVLVGKYKVQPNHVLTLSGKIHYYTDPIKVQMKMDQLMEWYSRNDKKISAVDLAARFHYRLVKIHPFDDGNGRLARILMNLILIKAGFLPAVIKNKERRGYLRVLEWADKGKLEMFVDFVAKQLIQTMDGVLRILKGEAEVVEPEVILTALDRREMILKKLERGQKYGLADVLRLVMVKRPTLKKDLRILVEEKKLKCFGNGKATRYRLK